MSKITRTTCHFALTICALLLFPVQASADQSAKPQPSAAELERRIDICRNSEAWLQPACFETLRALARRSAPQKTTRLEKQPPSAPIHTKGTAQYDEVHMIGIYEAQEIRTKTGAFKRSEVDVHVDRPGKSVALVIASHTAVRWLITTSPGTKVTRVLFSSNHARRTEVTLNGQPANAELVNLPLAYKPRGKNFHDFHETAAQLTGMPNAHSFQGAYKAPKHGFYVVAAPGLPTRAELQAEINKSALPRNALSPKLRAALTSDVSTLRGKWNFGAKGFTGVNSTGTAVHYDLSLNVPEVSWPVGAAHDPKNQILWGVTLGGEGFLYEYNIPQKRWLAWSMNNIDVGGLIFDPDTNRLIATPGQHFNRGFLVMDRQANVISQFQISQSDFPGLIDASGSGSGRAPALKPLAIDNGKLLVRAQFGLNQRNISHNDLLYLIDLNTRQVSYVR